jgi:Leucine-rich repeat (LRR) protein
MRVFSVLFVCLLHHAALLECYGGGNSISACPSMCTCTLDVAGRRQAVCDKGRMTTAIPSINLSSETEVLIITAPEGDDNLLTIGPVFNQLGNLEELTVSRSQIPAIGDHSFWGLKHLRKLDLTHNNIQQVTDKNFRGLGELETLRLDHNQINSMPSNSFRYMVELRSLSLSHNKIKELVPRVFMKLNKLKSLDLSGNPLGDLYPDVFKDIMELKELRCHACGLAIINEQMYGIVEHLEYLDLSNNQFKFFRVNEFLNLTKLRHLNLAGNQLSVVMDKTFGASSPNLKFLSLARNRLAKVTTKAFEDATNLQTLDLSYNKLSSLERASFDYIGEPLRSLNLSGNNIEPDNLKMVLQAVLKLRELSLADMGLSTLPLGVFIFHEHIRFLNLSNNQFQHFAVPLLAPLMKLKELDLSNNKFKGMNDQLVSRLEQAESGPNMGGEVMAVKARGSEGILVKLKGNPWQCDQCHIKPILDWISRFSTQEEHGVPDCNADNNNIECLRCSSPRSLAGMALNQLDLANLDFCNHGRAGSYGEEESLLAGFVPRLGLLAALAAAAVVVMLILIAVAFMALAHGRQAAHYYTHEDDRIPASASENEAIFSNPDRLTEDVGKYATMLASGKYPDAQLTTKSNGKVKFVTIATIDEITKDPDLTRTPLKNGVGS